MTSIDAGQLLDERYLVVARRAAGATATVWETQDEFLGRRVAVKVLHEHLAADADFLARFVEEARTAATVNHPNLVAVYDSITDHPGIVLKWVEGPDLRQRLDTGPLEPHEAVALGTALCAGLTALHEQGLVHRDVKPANILLGPGSSGMAISPKLTDFGIATSNAGDRTATGVVLGTAKYLAPEQVRGQSIDGRADVFALAAVLYEALSGRAPWNREGDLPTALARLEEDPPDLRHTHPALPAALTGAVMRGLAREPDDRWPDAASFAAALAGGSTLAPTPTAPIAVPVPDPPTPPQIRRPTPTVAMSTPSTPVDNKPRPVRPRGRRWPRVIGFLIVVAIALLGWTLVSGSTNDPLEPVTSSEQATIVSSVAFDPEGTGAPGEHNDRARFAIDRDTSTWWTTERYDARDLGLKSGVGLVLTLDRVTDLDSITIRTTDSEGWSVQLHVATGVDADPDGGINDFGVPVGGGTDLGESVQLDLEARGDTVVVWITDLGRGATPIRLAISEITIR